MFPSRICFISLCPRRFGNLWAQGSTSWLIQRFRLGDKEQDSCFLTQLPEEGTIYLTSFPCFLKQTRDRVLSSHREQGDSLRQNRDLQECTLVFPNLMIYHLNHLLNVKVFTDEHVPMQLSHMGQWRMLTMSCYLWSVVTFPLLSQSLWQCYNNNSNKTLISFTQHLVLHAHVASCLKQRWPNLHYSFNHLKSPHCHVMQVSYVSCGAHDGHTCE